MSIKFSKYEDGLAPAIIQDNNTGVVLMLGFINAEAYQQTKQSGLVHFYSRSKQRIWLKGETSGNYLKVINILQDCDEDTLLIKVIPAGPVCHTGADTCFNENNSSKDFLNELEIIIDKRVSSPSNDSYISNLFSKGINKIAQKVGEEAVELVIESKDNDEEKFMNEAADLLFHYLLLLHAKGKKIQDVKNMLESRHRKS